MDGSVRRMVARVKRVRFGGRLGKEEAVGRGFERGLGSLVMV